MNMNINTLLDPVVNFGKVTVLGGHTDSIDDTGVTLIAGDGSKLPNPADPVNGGSFNLVWFNNSTYSDPADDPYVEIVRCITRSNDTLIVIRGQEGTSASAKNIPTKIYKMILSPTKKTIDDIQTESQSKVNTHSALSTGVHGVGADTIDGVNARNIAISTHSSVTSNIHGFNASGDAPAQTHGISRHTGTIGTWANIDKTTSSIADITTRSHTSLTDIGTNAHTTIDTSISNSTAHIGASVAHGVSSDIVGISDTQTLTNKTLTSPFISTIYGGTTGTSDLILQSTSSAAVYPPTALRFRVGMAFGSEVEAMVLSQQGGYHRVGIGGTASSNLFYLRSHVNDHSSNGIYLRHEPSTGYSLLDMHTNYNPGAGGNLIKITHGSSPALTLNNSGNLGVGTGSPAAKLSVNGGLHIGGDSDPGDNNLLVDGDTSVTGNVGIGTTSPETKLHVQGGSGNPLDDGSYLNYLVSRFKNTGSGNQAYVEIRSVSTGNCGLLLKPSTATGTSGWGFITSNSGDLRIAFGSGITDLKDGVGGINILASNNYVGIGTTYPTAKLHISGTPGTDGIKFPDGTLQTTAAGGATVNLLIGLTPTFTLWDSLPSTNAQITDENMDQAFTTAGGFTRENWVYISFDMGSEKRIAAFAYIESASQSRSGIQFSHNGSTWYSVPNGIGKTRYIRAGMYGSYPPMTYTCTKFKMSAYAL